MSPQFHFMAKTLREGKLGRVAAAHASYGNAGPSWSSFFYDQSGGSMPDLGVYNLMTLTGLFGPARSVVAMLSTITPTRDIRRKRQNQSRGRGQRHGSHGPWRRRHFAHAVWVQLP